MKICSRCGNEISETTTICPICSKGEKHIRIRWKTLLSRRKAIKDREKSKSRLVVSLSLLLLLVSGCGEKSSGINSFTENDTAISSGASVSTENYSTAEQSDNMTTSVLEDTNLSETDLNIVSSILEQREMWETKQDEESYEYTRKPIDIYYIRMYYDGNNTLFIPMYLWKESSNTVTTARVLNTCYKVSATGKLSVLPDYELADANAYANKTGSIASIGYKKSNDEQKKFEDLCALYSDYLEDRLTQYADLGEEEKVNINELSEEKRNLFDNIYNNKSVWENREFKRAQPALQDCVFIKIWNFGGGTAELYCYYGIKRTVNDQNYYSGYEFGYYLGNGNISELTDKETSRLRNDLSSQEKCEWTVTWTDEKKKKVIFDYLCNLVN